METLKSQFCSSRQPWGDALRSKEGAWEGCPGYSLTLPTPTSSHKFIPPKFVSYKALGALLRWEGRGFICQEHLWGVIFCSSPACAWPCHGCCPSPVLKYLFLWIPVEEMDSFYPLFQMAATREEDLGHLPKFPLEVFGGDLYPGLQPHAVFHDHCSRPPWLRFSLSSLKAGTGSITSHHHFILNLITWY